MPKGPVRDGSPLNDDERPLLDDFVTLMERALARRRQLVFEPQQVTSWRPEDRDGRALMYRSLADGELIEPEEYERRRQQNKPELDELERAMLPLASAARARTQLVALFRPDVHPTGPLAEGAFAANRGKGWMESADDWWERAATWAVRLRDSTHEPATAIGQVQRALRELKETYAAFERPVPDTEQIEREFKPRTQRKRIRRMNSIFDSLSRLTGLSKDKIKDAVGRSDERAHGRGEESVTVEAEKLHEMFVDKPRRERQARMESEMERARAKATGVGRTVQQERARRMLHPFTFASWADEPPLDPPPPDNWANDTAEERKRRFQDATWDGSKLGPRTDPRTPSE